AALAFRPDLELVPLGNRTLVCVTRNDQLGPGVDESAENAVAPRDRPLPGPPRGAGQLVVQRDHPQRTGGSRRELSGGPRELVVVHAARLVAPWTHRVDAHEAQVLRCVYRAGRLPEALELDPRSGEPRRERVRDIVVAWNGDDRRPEPTQQSGRPFVL